MRLGGERPGLGAGFRRWRPAAVVGALAAVAGCTGGPSVQVGPLVTGSLQLRLSVEEGRLRGLGRPIGDVVGPGGRLRPAVDGVVAEPVACPVAP